MNDSTTPFWHIARGVKWRRQAIQTAMSAPCNLTAHGELHGNLFGFCGAQGTRTFTYISLFDRGYSVSAEEKTIT